MNSSIRNFSVRKNFILLLLLSISGSVILCWAFFMVLVIFTGGPIFQDKSQMFLDIFMVFAFPFFLGAGISIFSLVLTAIARQKWWISVPASIFLLGLPLVAYIITWLGSWIARFFYIPTSEDAERTKQFLSMSVSAKDDKPDTDIENIKKMKLLLDEGIITPDEFATQKQKIVSMISNETMAQSLPRFFSIWQTTSAAILGGFLAGAILISINFKRLGDKDRFKGALIVGFLGYFIALLIGVFVSLFVTNLNPMLIIPVTLVYPIIIYLWHNESLKQTIAALVQTKQARNESWWAVAGVSFLAVVFNFLSLIPIMVILAYLDSATVN